MDWFRMHHGTPTDAKWLGVARRAGEGATPGNVYAVWGALLDCASQARPRGDIESFDTEAVADGFGWAPAMVLAIFNAMAGGKKPVHDFQRLLNWDKRQPNKQDRTAAKRAKQYRERLAGKKPAKVPESQTVSDDRHGVTERDDDDRHAVTGSVTPLEERERQSLSRSDQASSQATNFNTSTTTADASRGGLMDAVRNLFKAWSSNA